MKEKERKRAVQEQFDRVSSGYLAERLTKENIRERKRILELVYSGRKYRNVLDMGCGPGTLCEGVVKISEKVCGFDISREMIKITIRRNEENGTQDKI
jgi:ubiquinone/menaquinone biosynthesis C-methylase UbiE